MTIFPTNRLKHSLYCRFLSSTFLASKIICFYTVYIILLSYERMSYSHCEIKYDYLFKEIFICLLFTEKGLKLDGKFLSILLFS